MGHHGSQHSPRPHRGQRRLRRARAAIVTEDGTESFNVFDHNFAVRTQGNADVAPRGGYGGPGPDPGGEGSGFWFRGRTTTSANNVAASADVFGFKPGGIGRHGPYSRRQGCGHDDEAGTQPFDTGASPVLEFRGQRKRTALFKSASTAAERGRVELPSCGTRRGTGGRDAYPSARHRWPRRAREPTVLADRLETRRASGLALPREADRHPQCDIEGLRTGIASPFVARSLATDPARDRGRS